MRKIFFVLLFALFFFSFKNLTFAEEIDSFDVNLISHEDGSMHVVEKINYNFGDLDRHGIYRYIPLYTKVGDFYRIIKIDNISISRDGLGEKFEKSTDGKQIKFKIGNGDKTISGAHTYIISYDVKNGIGSNFPNYDEIYWNVTGNGWNVSINKASIKFENDFGAKITNMLCFEGALGAQDKTCNINGNVVTSGQILYPGYGLTSVAVYPKNTFPPSNLSKTPPSTFGEKISNFFLKHVFSIYFLTNIVLPIVIIIWYQKHKNKKRFGKPSVNFDLPKDNKGERISPALAGTIDNAKLDRDDVLATIFDLAIRKYIRLESEKTEKTLGIFGSGEKQKIVKLKEIDAKLNNFEKELFERLFRDGDFVYVEDLKIDFYKTYQSIEEKVFSMLVAEKYYVRNPKIQRGLLFFAGIISLFTLNIILAFVFFFLSKKLIGRTALGDEIDFKIDGLKLFLKSMDRNYNWQAHKFYTVEQMIPYAMSLGYIDRFMEQLKIINPDYNPSWYHGYSSNFYLAYGSFYSSMNSNITTASPSSSGSGGGGFSGGGGGGGGGGSW